MSLVTHPARTKHAKERTDFVVDFDHSSEHAAAGTGELDTANSELLTGTPTVLVSQKIATKWKDVTADFVEDGNGGTIAPARQGSDTQIKAWLKAAAPNTQKDGEYVIVWICTTTHGRILVAVGTLIVDNRGRT